METEGYRSEEEQKAALRFEREQTWQAKKEEIEQVTDRLGFPIEPHIKNTVVGLNLFGLNTVQSCEGHSDRGIGAPWVEIAAPNEPEWRFIGQMEIFEQIAEKYGVSIEAVLHADNEEAWQEAWQLTTQKTSTTTPDYEAWEEKTRRSRERAGILIEEYYKDRKIEAPVALFLDGDRIHNGGSDYMLVKEMDDEQRSGLPERLVTYQSETESFSSFLMGRYLAEGTSENENSA